MAKIRQTIIAWDTGNKELTVEMEVREDGTLYICLETDPEDMTNIIVSPEDAKQIADFLMGRVGRS